MLRSKLVHHRSYSSADNSQFLSLATRRNGTPTAAVSYPWYKPGGVQVTDGGYVLVWHEIGRSASPTWSSMDTDSPTRQTSRWCDCLTLGASQMTIILFHNFVCCRLIKVVPAVAPQSLSKGVAKLLTSVGLGNDYVLPSRKFRRLTGSHGIHKLVCICLMCNSGAPMSAKGSVHMQTWVSNEQVLMQQPVEK